MSQLPYLWNMNMLYFAQPYYGSDGSDGFTSITATCDETEKIDWIETTATGFCGGKAVLCWRDRQTASQLIREYIPVTRNLFEFILYQYSIRNNFLSV